MSNVSLYSAHNRLGVPFVLAAICAVMLLMIGCTGTTPRPTAQPGAVPHIAASTEWQPIPCSACASANVVLEVRRTVDASGNAGRYSIARVRNENAYAIVVDIALHESTQTLDVDGFPTTNQRIQSVLQSAGAERSMYEAVLDIARVRTAVLRGVERL